MLGKRIPYSCVTARKLMRQVTECYLATTAALTWEGYDVIACYMSLSVGTTSHMII